MRRFSENLFLLRSLFLLNSLRKAHFGSCCNSMSKNADNQLQTFQRICDEILEERSYLKKSSLLSNFLKKGSDGKSFKGDLVLWVQMLLPDEKQRVYNLQNKQLIKLFSRLFACDAQKMHLDLEQEGDVSETLRKFFETSSKLKPQSQSTLTLQEVDAYLVELEKITKEEQQTELLGKICKQSTALDLRTIVRLIKQDLRITAGARHILDAFGPLAYPAYQSSRDLEAVVKQFAVYLTKENKETATKAGKKASSKIGQVQVMTPISPMLANACNSVDEAFKKNPTGLYSEIKYDGERVQIHKKDSEFKFFSRNLKPVMDHKVKSFHQHIPKAFPGGGDMILDSEIIMVNKVTGELLPFGTLGAHKKKEHDDAEVCLFVFDCLLFDGEDLTSLAFRERRKILESNIKPIKSHVQLSESHFLKTKNELALMTAKVLKANLEGVVLKSPTGIYEPGKRKWLKVKKDYLFGGKMADTADLVVLGAWFGSGKKGGILSIFLMGCFDPNDHLWKTVTKVHSGLDDATNDEIHKKLMKLMERADANHTPTWLLCKKALVPDYIAKSPKAMPVWEITGAEFTKSEAHTAAGISIRFPRITKLRDDKSAEQANDLPHLQQMYAASKQNVNVDLLIANYDDDDDDDSVDINSKLNASPSKNNKTPQKTATPTSSGKKLKRSVADELEQLPNSKKPKTEQKTKTAQKQLTLDFALNQKSNAVDSKRKTNTKELKTEMSEIVLDSTLFNNQIAYFVKEHADIMQKFKANGGQVAHDSKDANFIFYSTIAAKMDLNKSRNLFNKSCRHLSIEWINDSLSAKECQPYAMYAVVIKT